MKVFGKKFPSRITPRSLSLSAILCATFALGCQTFELDKVEPEAVAAEQHDTPIVGVMDKSFIMLVIDKSGSMLNGVQNPMGSCKVDGGLGYDRSGDCRWNSLLDAFAGTTNGSSKGFLRTSKEANDGKGSALFGLATYPLDIACTGGNVSVKLNTDNDNVEKIISELNNIAPAGGTPTAPTLNNLLSMDSLLSTPSNTRKRFVMLLTDGAPNCNASQENAQRCDACNAAQNVNDCNDLTTTPWACYPTNSSGTMGMGNTCDMNYRSNPSMYGTDCLDKDGTVRAIEALRAVGVETFVIGFGNVSDNEASRMTLNEAAIAGGHPVGNAGDGVRFYEATDTDSLSQALEAILKATTGCSFPLSPKPRSCDEVEVKLRTVADNSVRILAPETEWTCTEDADSTIIEILDGNDAICSEKLMTSPANTYEIQFFYSVDL